MTPCFVSDYSGRVHIITGSIAPHTHDTTALCGESFRARELYALPRPARMPHLEPCALCAETADANGIAWRTR